MSKRTIQLAQKTLDVSTNNMSNIMTPGFTRQRVDIHSMSLRTFKNWQTSQARLSLAGQGVGAFGVAQIRDPYLDKRFREMNSHLAEFEVKQPIYEELQTTIDLYENIGMDGILARFKAALSTFATDAADNRELATIVRNSAFDITKMLNSYARDFNKLLENNIVELQATVDYTNSLIDRVFLLNQAIVKDFKATEFGNIATGKGVSPYGPLELMDSRNLLIDELSSYMNLRVEENTDGSINLFMGDVLMVDGIENFEHLVMRDFEGFGAAVIVASNGHPLNIRSGEIKGYMELVNGNGPYASHSQSSAYGIPYYMNAMDAFAEAFADLMNRTNGVTGLTAEESFRAMFASTLDVYGPDGHLIERGPITAATIRISDEWMADANMIGQVFNEEERSFSTYTFNTGTGPYTFNVTFNNIPATITFDGTAGDLHNQLQARFPNNIQVINRDGVITVSAVNNRNPLTITSTDVSLTEEVTHVPAGWAYSPNLDGTQLHTLLLALDQPIMFGRMRDFEGTPFDYVAFLTNRLGQGIQFLDEERKNMTVTTNNLLDSRDAIAGVSTDEEGINMLIYQKWYNAAARMMTAMDEMLDRVINGMGRVGL
jgi:flagellar hook-associated protein 1 FlgK